jgi:hypothetical protein
MGEGVLISSELSVMGEFGRVKVYLLQSWIESL